VVTQNVIKLGARLHRILDCFLRTVLAQGSIDIFGCGGHRPVSRQWIQCEAYTDLRELSGRKQRRFSELGEIRQHRYFDRACELCVLVERRQCFRANHVRAGLDIRCCAVECRLLPFNRVGIGARHDREFCVASPVHRSLDAVDHLPGLHQRFARTVTAAFHGYLILDVAGCRAGAFHFLHRAADHEGTAPAGIRINQQGQIAGIGDATNVLADIRQRGHREVRQAEGGVGDAGTGQVDRPESGFVRKQCRIRIDRADDLQRSFLFKGLPESLAGARGHDALHSRVKF
jgi:hypothetical protein